MVGPRAFGMKAWVRVQGFEVCGSPRSRKGAFHTAGQSIQAVLASGSSETGPACTFRLVSVQDPTAARAQQLAEFRFQASVALLV